MKPATAFLFVTLALGGSVLCPRPVRGDGGPMTIQSGSVVGGAGVIKGTVQPASGATVAPGNGIGTLTVDGLILSNGCLLDYELTTGASDFISVAAADQLTINGGGVHLYQPGTHNTFNTPGTYQLIGYSGTLQGSASNLTVLNPGPGLNYSFANNATAHTIDLTIALPGPTPTATPSPTPTSTPTPTATATPTAPPAGFVANVSTRLPVGSNENVLIEGFIVQGSAGSTKKIIVRAIGPSLAPFGITDALGNPTLEIHNTSDIIASNDDWKVTQIGGVISGNQSAEIAASGVAPSDDRESAIIADLAPGSYTAVVQGAGGGTGTGVVDAYDLSTASPARLANIATRGLVQPGDKLMIAGFIIQNGPVRAVVRAIGPSLAAFGIGNALPDTTLQLKDQNGTIVVENDDWKVRSDGSSQQAELEATGLQPANDLEAAFVITLQPGQYTAQVRGKPETTGIGVVQVYFLQ